MVIAEIKAGYKKTDIGVIPEDWDVKPVSALLKEPPKYGINAPAVELRGKLPVYIRITDISDDGRFAPSEKVGVDSTLSHLYKLSNGDIVLARTGASVGKSYAYREEDGELIYAGFLIKITPNQSQLNSGYLAQFLQSDKYWSWVKINSMRSGQPGINGNEYGQLEIPLPKPEEQKQIAAALSDVDELIEVLSQLITKKRDMKTAAMQQLLTGKKRLPGFSGEWETPALEELANFYKGKFLPKSAIADSGKTNCIHYGELFTQYPEKIKHIRSKTNQPTSISFFSKANDVLMPTSDVTPNGLAKASCVLQEGIILGGDILVIRPKNFNQLNGVFLSYFIRFHKDEIMKRVSGSTVYHLYGSDIKNLVIDLPKIEEQDAIVSALEDMSVEIDALEQRLEKACSLKTGMMQELLTGKTRLIKTNKKQEEV
jgi:type I restriction enzyme, S subunit